MAADAAALIAAAGFVLLAGFQIALAAGVPWGRAAWGGKNAWLPQNLRVASGVAAVIWLLATLVVLDRGGRPVIDLPDAVAFWGTWTIALLSFVGAVVNFASSSPYERFGWAPYAAVLGLLTLVVALS